MLLSVSAEIAENERVAEDQELDVLASRLQAHLPERKTPLVSASSKRSRRQATETALNDAETSPHANSRALRGVPPPRYVGLDYCE